MVFCAEHPEPLEGAEQFLTQVVDVPLLAFDASHLGVLDSLSQVSDTGLARRFQNIALTLPWAESQRMPGMGDKAALCDLNAVFQFKGIAVGLLYLNKNVEYPQHDHAPQELYLVLSGTAAWRYGGDEDYKIVPPGNLIYNQPFDLHGVRNGGAPLVALYVLWGFD